MSSRRRAGFSEGTGAVPVNLCLKTLFAYRLFDDIHLAAQNTGETPFELAQAAEIIETWCRELLAQTHGHIDIPSRILSACDRAEQGYAHHASGAELMFMRPQGGYDVVALHGTNFAQRLFEGNRLVVVWAVHEEGRGSGNASAS